MKKIKFTIIIAGIILTATVSCTKNDKEIATDPGLYDLYIYNVNANTNSRITHSPNKMENEYSFSPDSKNILFTDYDSAYIMNLDGSGLKLLATHMEAPQYSRVGNEIVYVNAGNLYLVKTDGTDMHQLTQGNYDFWKPIWSGDGQKIACSSDSGLCIINMDGHITNFSHKNSAAWYDWSYDSKTLAYCKYVSNYVQLFKYDVSTGTETQLTYTYSYNYDPFWSPVQNKIIYTSSLGSDGSDLILMNADGTQPKTILHKNNILSPSWSPDGQFIAFITDGADVAIIDVNGNNYRVINDIKGACMEPHWSPDGKYILYYRAIFYD